MGPPRPRDGPTQTHHPGAGVAGARVQALPIEAERQLHAGNRAPSLDRWLDVPCLASDHARANYYAGLMCEMGGDVPRCVAHICSAAVGLLLVQVRDPRQVVLSLVHHMERRPQGRPIILRGVAHYGGLDFSGKVQTVLDVLYERMVR